MRALLLLAALLASGLDAGAAERAAGTLVGDWTLYRLMGMDEYKQRHSVIAVEDGDDGTTIVVEIVTFLDDRETGKEELRLPRAEMRAVEGGEPAGVETVVVKGMEIEARIAAKSEDDAQYLYYSSEAVPVNGLIRVEVVGMPTPVIELLDFGFGA